MSDLSATNCGCGCGSSVFGGDDNNCLFLILILLFSGCFGGCGNGCGSSFFGGDGNNSCFIIILLLLFCGNGRRSGNGCDCGCNSTLNLGC